VRSSLQIGTSVFVSFGTYLMKCSFWLFVAVASTSAALLSGCSSGGEVTKILIALTMDNTPLTDAEVRLVPKDDPSLGDGCSGKTASDGKVEIVINPKRPLKAGRYVVLVQKLVNKDGSSFKQEQDVAVRPSMRAQVFKAENVVPVPYNDKDRALLIVELTPGENKPPPLDLDSKKK
jgi:hypothetical protein